MKESKIIKLPQTGQAMIEYMLLLGVVVAMVMVFFKTHMADRVPKATALYFNSMSNGILGKPPTCGDGVCDNPYETNASCCDCFGGC